MRDLLIFFYTQILVDLDISKGLPVEIKLESPMGCWIQSLDYEGNPFRCRCFKIGHVMAHYGLEKLKKPTWQKGA